jgi:hypothetical protein
MQEEKKKDKGIWFWMEICFQRWILSRVLIFFILFDPYTYERATDS